MIDFTEIDKTWTLFLDRDGVINTRIPNGYVTKKEDFVFLSNVKGSISAICRLFCRVIVCTNQQGVAKGFMTKEELDDIHEYMQDKIGEYGGFIDGVYSACELASDENNTRKPKPFMAEQAKKDFPEIDFSKSIMIGDTDSDIKFGKNLGMKTILVVSDEIVTELPDYEIDSLWDFAIMMAER